MIALIVSILIGWLMLKMLWPRAPIYIEPPPPQVVIFHLHLMIVPVKDSGQLSKNLDPLSPPPVGGKHWRAGGVAVD